jgi:hypothetical protein
MKDREEMSTSSLWKYCWEGPQASGIVIPINADDFDGDKCG